MLGPAAEQGILPTMFSDIARERPMIATPDIGRVAAELLLDPAAPPLVELAGPEDYCANDAAAAYAAALGRTITPVQPPREAWVSILVEAGLGAPSAALIAEMYDGINSGHVRFSGEAPLRRGRVTLTQTLTGLVGRHAA